MKEEKVSKEDIQKAKKISILDYLKNRGFKINRHYSGYALMCSPLRKDRSPSFKVDKRKNHWYDFGTDENGDVIELVRRLEQKNFPEAVRSLLSGADSFSFHCPKESIKTSNEESPKIRKIKSQITNQALVDYLKARRIPVDLASRYLDEVYYYAQDKHYFALGFKNESDGYEIRNKYFKGSLGSKDVTLINGEREPRNSVCVFEGFMDFLSVLAYRQLDKPQFNVLVLNSISLVEEGLKYIILHDRSYLYLDQDEAGRKATAQIRAESQHESLDLSGFYGQKGFKDFNEFFMNNQTT